MMNQKPTLGDVLSATTQKLYSPQMTTKRANQRPNNTSTTNPSPSILDDDSTQVQKQPEVEKSAYTLANHAQLPIRAIESFAGVVDQLRAARDKYAGVIRGCRTIHTDQSTADTVKDASGCRTIHTDQSTAGGQQCGREVFSVGTQDEVHSVNIHVGGGSGGIVGIDNEKTALLSLPNLPTLNLRQGKFLDKTAYSPISQSPQWLRSAPPAVQAQQPGTTPQPLRGAALSSPQPTQQGSEVGQTFGQTSPQQLSIPQMQAQMADMQRPRQQLAGMVGPPGVPGLNAPAGHPTSRHTGLDAPNTKAPTLTGLPGTAGTNPIDMRGGLDASGRVVDGNHAAGVPKDGIFGKKAANRNSNELRSNFDLVGKRGVFFPQTVGRNDRMVKAAFLRAFGKRPTTPAPLVTGTSLDPKFQQLVNAQMGDTPRFNESKFGGDDLDLLELVMEYEDANNVTHDDSWLPGNYETNSLTYGQLYNNLRKHSKPTSSTAQTVKMAGSVGSGRIRPGNPGAGDNDANTGKNGVLCKKAGSVGPGQIHTAQIPVALDLFGKTRLFSEISSSRGGGPVKSAGHGVRNETKVIRGGGHVLDPVVRSIGDQLMKAAALPLLVGAAAGAVGARSNKRRKPAEDDEPDYAGIGRNRSHAATKLLADLNRHSKRQKVKSAR